MRIPRAVIAALVAAGCSPTLDWREIRPEGADVAALFPCRPDRHARPVLIGGARTSMEMLVCSAGGATFAVSFVDLVDPALVTAAVAELRTAALTNIGGVQLSSEPVQVSGMTANVQAARLVISGRLPDGDAVHEQAAFFVKGLRVYQASIIGARLRAEMTDPFFASLKLPS